MVLPEFTRRLLPKNRDRMALTHNGIQIDFIVLARNACDCKDLEAKLEKRWDTNAQRPLLMEGIPGFPWKPANPISP